MEWRRIELGDGHYEVSDAGHVRNSLTGQTLKPCKAGKYGQYLNVRLCFNGFSKNYRLHRLVAKAFCPNPLARPQVNHINGRHRDNRASNLEWVSAKENIQHSYREGLRTRVFSFADAQEIRRQYAEGLKTQAQIAADRGVSITAIWRILKNLSFRPEVFQEKEFNAAA